MTVVDQKALGLLVVLCAACSVAPARRVAHAPRVAHPAAPQKEQRAAAAPSSVRPSVTPPARLLEEGEIGEAAALPATPEQVAAIPPAAVPAPTTASEPESLVTHISATTPPNAAAAFRLIEDGRQQMTQGRYDRALDRFERSVAVDPTNAYGYYFLAQLHFQTKKYDQAVAFASRAAALSARSDPVCLGRAYSLEGAAFEAVGRYPDARKAYQKAVDADPNNLAARVGVARLNPQ